MAVFFFIHVQFLSSWKSNFGTYKIFDRSHHTEPEIILLEQSTKKLLGQKVTIFFACHFHRLLKSFKFLRRQKIITFYSWKIWVMARVCDHLIPRSRVQILQEFFLLLSWKTVANCKTNRGMTWILVPRNWGHCKAISKGLWVMRRFKMGP